MEPGQLDPSGQAIPRSWRYGKNWDNTDIGECRIIWIIWINGEQTHFMYIIYNIYVKEKKNIYMYMMMYKTYVYIYVIYIYMLYIYTYIYYIMYITYIYIYILYIYNIIYIYNIYI